MDGRSSPIPTHIPASLVFDFDYIDASKASDDPHMAASRLLFGHAPDIFYTPRNGGHWVVTRQAAAIDMLRQPDTFSSHPRYNEARMWSPLLLPIQSDPPDHTDYRRTLGAYFAPGMMEKLEPDIRRLARDIFDELLPRGRCEFVTEIGEVFPITIFLRLVKAPMADRSALLAMAQKFTRSPSPQDRAAAVGELAGYIRGLFDQRRDRTGDDILTRLMSAGFRGRPLTRDEEEGLGTLLFLGGLDTVKSVLSFIMLYLARNPDQYRRLVEDRDLIPTAIEELMRVSGVSIPERGVTHDLDYHGIPFKQGDRLIFLTPVMGLDERELSCPFQVKLDRDVSPHLIFGAGPHRCAGSHLARIEIRVFLEEWTRSFPNYSIDPASKVEMAGGIVWTPGRLPLVWPTK
jgi:cytochrome P450